MNRSHNKKRRYTQEDILAEANMFLDGYTVKEVAAALKTPVSTVSWHLIYPLKEIDYATWTRVRIRLDKYAKNKSRVIHMYKHVTRPYHRDFSRQRRTL